MLQPYQERILAESQELGARLGKLEAFVGSPAYKALDEAERDRLWRQRECMREYFEILGERIRAFAS